MEALLEELRRFDALRDSDEIALRTVPCNPPEFAPPAALDAYPEFLRSALRDMGIQRLYAHQDEAIMRALGDQDLVLESPTASGKTLCFNIPLILKLLDDPTAHAMMLHPMKALSNDQRRQFDGMTKPLGNSLGRRIESWVYDGDTEELHRKPLRDNPPALILTNPDMLHKTFLGWSELWERYLRNLRMLIIDEMHEYRGFFGTNFALLLRRFLCKLARLGARPQLVLATATCANPLEHARRLTGRDSFAVVRSGNGMRPTRHYAFINPRIPDFKFMDIFGVRVARAALACVNHGFTTLVFCPSRRFVEVAYRIARQGAPDPDKLFNCAPYKGGYPPEKRREIEEGLR